MKENLKKLIDLIGGQSALASSLKSETRPVTQAHVWKWLNTTVDGIPAEHVIKACEAIGWEVTPHELRPDLYPHPQDGLPDHLREVA